MVLSEIKKFYAILEGRDRNRLAFLVVAIGVNSLLEVSGIGLVLPFLQLAATPNAINDNALLSSMYQNFGFTSERSLLLALGIGVVGLLCVSNFVAAFTVLMRERIAASIDHQVSMRLVRLYTNMNYGFFLKNDSATLIKKIVTDVSHLVSGILLTGSQLVCEVVLTGAITLLLLYLQPFATTVTILVVGLLYGGVYFSRRSYISRLGKERLEIDRERFRTFVDIISGIKSIQSYGVQEWFTKRHEQPSEAYAELQPKVAFISTLPRYFVEALAYSSVVLTTLYLVISGQDFLQALPMLILFALAGHRIIPSLNGIYNCLAKVLEAYPAIGYIYDDLYSAIAQPIESKGLAALQERITFEDVCFRYETNEDLVLNHISLTFTRGSKIGIVGPSGSGKSTLIEILMGLLEPTAGTVAIDETMLDATTRHSWHRQTGFVPQDVFLYDDTVARNVAFGCDKVDLDWVQECCKIAQVHDFIQSELPQGYATKLGEQGIRLSGGQRQRIGLARALYGKPEILLLDEATSALDSVTERHLVSAIYEYFPDLTIVMIAHRISTVEQCEVLYVLDRGRLVGSGTYQSLVDSSELFRGLASFSN